MLRKLLLWLQPGAQKTPKLYADEVCRADIELMAQWHERDIRDGHYNHPGADIRMYLWQLVSGKIAVISEAGPELVQTQSMAIRYGERLVGFAVLRPWGKDKSSGELWALSIAPEMQGRGLGRAALKLICDKYLPQYKGLYVRCLPASIQMCRLLESAGFKHMDTSRSGIKVWLLSSKC